MGCARSVINLQCAEGKACFISSLSFYMIISIYIVFHILHSESIPCASLFGCRLLLLAFQHAQESVVIGTLFTY